MLLAYRFLPGQLDPHDPTPVADPHVMLLGLGTTTAVMVQCLILLPYLKKAGINLRPKWGLDARIKQFGGMAVASITWFVVPILYCWVAEWKFRLARSAPNPDVPPAQGETV